MTKRIALFGAGSFAHSLTTLLQEAGAEVTCWFDRKHSHFGAASVSVTQPAHANPLPMLKAFKPNLIIPMSLAWHAEPWAAEWSATAPPVLSPLGEALELERSRSYATDLCEQYGIPIPRSYTASTREEAIAQVLHDPRPYVVKNPICSPNSPIQAIVCSTVEATLAWLEQVDDSEGVFLQEYMGDIEAGHFVAVSGGEIVSLVTNQEYKRAHTGNLGPVASAPLAGIVERDPQDHYGLAKNLIHPLKPWFERTGFHGILQVTGMRRNGVWHAIEYNVRLGVTTGPLLLQMIKNPIELLLAVALDQPAKPLWRTGHRFGASLTLAGYGYPHALESMPELPVLVKQPLACRLWWNHVHPLGDNARLHTEATPGVPLRIADLNATGPELNGVINQLYEEIGKIQCQGSSYRLDVGRTLWPPGTGAGDPRQLTMHGVSPSKHNVRHIKRHPPSGQTWCRPAWWQA